MSHGPHIQPKTVPQIQGREQTLAALTNIRAVLQELHHVVEQETDLIHKAHVREAHRLEAAKKELSRQFFTAIDLLKRNLGEFRQHAPEGLKTLAMEHGAFQTLLERNMAVLATAHAVTEGIVRQAARFAAAERMPQGYGANGAAPVPNLHKAGPMMVTKVL